MSLEQSSTRLACGLIFSSKRSRCASSTMATTEPLLLDQLQLDTFLQDGVLVVDDILSKEELERARNGLEDTLRSQGVDPDHLEGTGRNLASLSSTNGSGGVLDIFYTQWQLKVASNPKLWSVTKQLWDVGYDATRTDHRWHPHGAFDTQSGYMYLDRVGYRLPTALAQKLGTSKKRPIQRSLTPHLDCCPESFHEDPHKWRPIQCFVSLTDNLQPNTGGFEAAKGFHREFDDWAKARPATQVTKGGVTETIPAPCIGNYTHIRPNEDKDIMDRVNHIPVKAGSVVFWDNRIPHANSYRHDGDSPRAVVYCSFLPNVPKNRLYAERQLDKWKRGQYPSDQWIAAGTDGTDSSFEQRLSQLSPLARKLLSIDPWSQYE